MTETRSLTIAVPLAGEMGAAIGGVLTSHGLDVLTCTIDRSERTRQRAALAGLQSTDHAGLAAADIVLSIVPPGIAISTALAIAQHFGKAAPPPLYVDCNAVSPRTAREIASIVETASGSFLDGSLIGPPPCPGGTMPKLYVSGPNAELAAKLSAFGLDIRRLNGEVGAASALKMAYGGLTKGLTGLTAALVLAAHRAGVGDELLAEMADSQAALLTRSGTALPDMVPKAYRWTAEMNAVAEFVGERPKPESGVLWLSSTPGLRQTRMRTETKARSYAHSQNQLSRRRH